MIRINYGLGFGDMDVVMTYRHDLYFESAAVILVLITVGKYLEVRSKSRTGDAIRKLMDLQPKTARVLRNGVEVEIDVEEVLTGDMVLIKPGESIPVDGIIREGSTSLDESALTGESMPVAKAVGDKVISATINKTGAIRFEATSVGEDTTIAQIIALVEDANATKAPIQRSPAYSCRLLY
jgi:Cu+-exporting ATPase